MRLISYNCHEALCVMWASLSTECHLLHYEDVYYWRSEHRPKPSNVYLYEKGLMPRGRFDLAIAFNTDTQWNGIKHLVVPKVNALATTFFDAGNPKNQLARPGPQTVIQLRHRNVVFCGETQKKRWGLEDWAAAPVIYYGVDPAEWEPGPRDNGRACVVAHDFRHRDNVLDFYWTASVLDGLPWHVIGRQRDGLPAIYPESIGGLKEIYKNYSVFFYTPHTSPLSFSLIEAMMMGMAIVARPYDDIPYFLKNGENAIVSMDDVVLREGVERCLKDKAYREQLGAGARDTALKLFTLERWQDETREWLSKKGVRNL